MKTNLDFFKHDSELEKEGVWLEVKEGVKFLVRRLGGDNSAAFKKAMAKYHKPYAKMIENGLLTETKEKSILAKVFIDTCLVTWEGVEIDGECPEYSKELALKLFENYPRLLDTLTEYASDPINYREDLGNS